MTMMDLFEDTEIVTPKVKTKIVSAPKYDDGVADFFTDNADSFLEALYLSEASKPPIASSTKYRMQIPDFFNNAISHVFSQEVLSITEHEGKPYDWLLLKKKISIKTQKSEIFPRMVKRGVGETLPKPVQLKNTKNTIVLKDGEFDYLLVAVTTKDICGLYLLGFDQVKKLLANSHSFDPNCDENGFDGKGQIKLYIHSKDDCLASIEMNAETRKKLAAKYPKVSPMKRDSLWLTMQAKCIAKQMEMTLKGDGK